MSCARASAKALLLTVAVVAACQDPARAPIPLTVSSDPPAQTAGGIITLTSDQFSGLTLLPSPDTLRTNRWTNFSVTVGADTADTWRVGPTQIAFRVPPVYTGNYEALIEAQGYDEARASFFAVGLAYPRYWGGLNAYTNVTTGTMLPGRGLLIAEGSAWPGFSTGYGLIDVQDRRLRMPAELREADSNRVKMYTPGPSYRTNHYIIDLSPAGRAAATVWKPDPWTLVDSLPCGVTAGDYTIDTLFHVTGAAFSTTGDTMFLTTSVRDSAAANHQGGRFSVSLYETATGRFLTARAFPSTRALQDITLDPVRPLLYVGGIQWEASSSLFRQYLTVLDRRTLDIVADMPVPAIPYRSSVDDATLVYQAGRVSVVGWCGFDCGGLWVFTFDLP